MFISQFLDFYPPKFAVVNFIIYVVLFQLKCVFKKNKKQNTIKRYNSCLVSRLRGIDLVTIKSYTVKCRPRMEYVGTTGSRGLPGNDSKTRSEMV